MTFDHAIPSFGADRGRGETCTGGKVQLFRFKGTLRVGSASAFRTPSSHAINTETDPLKVLLLKCFNWDPCFMRVIIEVLFLAKEVRQKANSVLKMYTNVKKRKCVSIVYFSTA